MGEIINSISFQENYLTWIYIEKTGSQNITIKRVVESALPFNINFDNLKNPTSALQIANHLKNLAETNDFPLNNIRFLLSGKFGMIKKFSVDQSIPENMQKKLVAQEMEYIMTGNQSDYHIYQPEYTRNHNAYSEILTFSIKKDLFTFFQKVALEAGFTIDQINLNCFSLDELYHRFFPNIIGQTLLVNWTARGFEIIVSDQNNFLNFSYKPYSKTLQSIDQLEEQEIFSAFSAIMEETQRPGAIDMPLYSISQVFLFGYYFKPHWLETLQNHCNLPLRVFNPLDSTDWEINSEIADYESSAHRFLEPLSNIF